MTPVQNDSTNKWYCLVEVTLRSVSTILPWGASYADAVRTCEIRNARENRLPPPPIIDPFRYHYEVAEYHGYAKPKSPAPAPSEVEA